MVLLGFVVCWFFEQFTNLLLSNLRFFKQFLQSKWRLLKYIFIFLWKKKRWRNLTSLIPPKFIGTHICLFHKRDMQWALLLQYIWSVSHSPSSFGIISNAFILKDLKTESRWQARCCLMFRFIRTWVTSGKYVLLSICSYHCICGTGCVFWQIFFKVS